MKSIILRMPVFIFLVFASCVPHGNIAPEDALRARVQAYWDARVEGSAEKAYQLLEPDARQQVSLGTYAHRSGQSEILSYEIEKIDLDLQTESAVVQVKRSFRIKPGAVPIRIDQDLEQTGHERWVMMDHQWYMSYGLPKLDLFKKPVGKGD